MKDLPFSAGDQLEAETDLGKLHTTIIAISPETGKVFIRFGDTMVKREIKDITKRVNNGTFKIIKSEEGDVC